MMAEEKEYSAVHDMHQDNVQTAVATQELDVAISKVFNIQSIRSAKLKAKQSKNRYLQAKNTQVVMVIVIVMATFCPSNMYQKIFSHTNVN